MNISALRIEFCKRGSREYNELLVPPKYHLGHDSMPTAARNVLQLYRLFVADIIERTRIAPNFDYAVELHQLLDDFEGTPIRARPFGDP